MKEICIDCGFATGTCDCNQPKPTDLSEFRNRLAKNRRDCEIPNTDPEFVRFLMNTLDEQTATIARLTEFIDYVLSFKNDADMEYYTKLKAKEMGLLKGEL